MSRSSKVLLTFCLSDNTLQNFNRINGLRDLAPFNFQTSSCPSSDTAMKIILGTGNFGSKFDPLVKNFHTVEEAQACLSLFRSYGFNHIDTARLYSCHYPGTCEPLLGQTNVSQWATIDSKVHAAPTLQRARILSEINASLQSLVVPEVNIYYLHGPDRRTPYEEQCHAMHEAYKAGKFKKFGISNMSPSEVDYIVQLCRKNEWIVPSVYQGHYNAISRTAEDDLIPILRAHQISFYAYSPAAGGMLSGTATGDPSTRRQGGRWKEEVSFLLICMKIRDLLT